MSNPYNHSSYGSHTPVYDILWPERKRVFGYTIRIWYDDAIANGELDRERDGRTLSTDEMALCLHLVGLITLKK